MRICTLIAIFFLSTLFVYAQRDDDWDDDNWLTVKVEEDSVGNESVEVSIAKRKDKKHLKNVKTRWVMLDLGFSSYYNKSNKKLENGIDPFEQNMIKSTNVNIILFRQKVNLIHHKLNLEWGTQFDFQKYYFEHPYRLVSKQPEVTWEEVPTEGLRKSRFSHSHFTIPLLLNFESYPWRNSKSFHLSAGVYGSVRTGGNHKVKTDSSKTKDRGTFNMNKAKYGVTAEIGYGPFLIYGKYDLVNLFKTDEDNGYELVPINVGFRIIPW